MSNVIETLFNKAYKGLAAQNWEQSSVGGVCMYRSDGGKKCAIGHLIDDEHYDVNFDIYNNCIDEFKVQDAVVKSNDLPEISKEVFDLLHLMQSYHDNYSEAGEMKTAFDEIAANCGFEIRP